MPRPYLSESYYNNWSSLTSAAQVQPVFFVSVEFGNVDFWLTTAIYDDGFGADPDGTVLGIEFPEDSLNGDKSEFTISFSGQNADFLAAAIAARQDLDFPTSGDDIPVGSVDLWFFQDDGDLDSQASYTICTGLMDNCEIIYSSTGIIINMTFQQSADWLWDRPGEGRFTDAYQKSRGNPSYSTSNPYYNDRGFEFVEALQNWQVHWTQPSPAKKPHKKKKKHKSTKGKRGSGGRGR